MSEFVVHGIPGSPYMRAALMILEEKGLSWRLQPLAPAASKSAEHLARHPFGRIPVVDHGDFRLYETQAVLRYVERLHPKPPLVPSDPRRAARMDQLIGINDWYLMAHVGVPIVFPKVIALKLGFPADGSGVADALPKAKVCIDEIARLHGGQPFLAGEDLSLADLMIAPQLSLTAQCKEGRDLIAPHPALSAWLDRMEARPSMIATLWDRLLDMAAA